MPNKVNIAKWIVALRSGRYHQGREILRTGPMNGSYEDQRFCCLGVACDISDTGSWTLKDFTWEYLDNSGLLPVEVIDWLGVGSVNPSLGTVSSARANDVLGYSFDTIADLLEKAYLGGEKAEAVALGE